MHRSSGRQALALSWAALLAGVACATTDPLIRAAGHGDTVEIERLLDAGGEVDVTEPGGDTPLMRAAAGAFRAQVITDARGNVTSSWKRAETEYVAAVELLLERGADPNWAGADGQTALHRAAYNGRLATVRVLLAGGANVSARDLDGESPLMFACGTGHESVVDLLLEAGADPSEGNQRINTLMTAAAGGHIEVMKKLLDLGVAVDTASKGGDTALSNAAWGGYPEAVALLLEHRAPVNSRDVLERTPLDVAVERVNLECAFLLRAAGGVEDGSDGE